MLSINYLYKHVYAVLIYTGPAHILSQRYQIPFHENNIMLRVEHCFTFSTQHKTVLLMSTTGVREIGGLTVMQALEIVRGCKGLNMVGGDVVEVGQKFK